MILGGKAVAHIYKSRNYSCSLHVEIIPSFGLLVYYLLITPTPMLSSQANEN